ncbi:PQQ-binding-like beta-propeller repeat protein [Cellulomonas sp. ATA003]|uniref:outer membrane protein assembly factor BamB family protein n=1 Tax=Cellulomonas sp. ATA003 TaxID=3073064 RepID=UPI002873195B|nr:PQQ-binding-like beta-propeller repeat protein [Cellulomonas sp. ATA003]WNB85830.1 PQQ-binding-like beta-propeller repeat protein [Cellulomonas sp. ATA003]
MLGGGEGTARVLDPATGDVDLTIALAAGDAWHVVDGDLVTIGLDADGRAAAGRWSLTTGEQQWAYHGAEAIAVDASTGWGTWLDGRTVGLEVGDWSVTLDVGTGVETAQGGGESLAGGGDAENVQRVELADGRVLVYGPTPSGDVRTTVHPADGGEPATVPGIVPPLAVDDGSVPGAVVAIDVESTGPWGLGMVDLDSGEWRWTSEAEGAGVAVLAGVVLVSDGSRVTALDARTGQTRWSSAPSSSPSFSGWEVATDGRRVLVLDGQGFERELVARDVRTGERVWATEPPLSDGALVPLPDGTVLMVGAGDLAALRP